MSDAIYIVGGARTPIGGLMGELASVSATELGSTSIKAAVERADLNTEAIDEIFMGCVLPAGLKQCPARQAARYAGIPDHVGAVTVNKACGSGMQATIFGIDSIRARTNSIAITGGFESMSNAPHLMLSARAGQRLGHTKIFDHMFMDGLEDAYTGHAMGSFAQATADEYGISREAMDDFSIHSLIRAKKAIEQGFLKAETVPIEVKTHRETISVVDDEQPLRGRIDKIPSLRAAFTQDGTITAANASSISDGASALILASESAVEDQGLTPMAKIVAHARSSRLPAEFTLAPVDAISSLLDKTGWSADDVDLWEINEAFALVTIIAMKAHGLDHSKVNVHGGACAQGHPIGSTGSRIIVTLMHAMHQYGKRRGVAALCIGGGEATAVAIEKP